VSLATFVEANELVRNPEEEAVAKDGLNRATTELQRQKDLKKEVDAAVKCLVGDTPDPQGAQDRFEAALAIEMDEGTPERNALLELREVSILWAEGDENLKDWNGEDALHAYRSCQVKAQAVANIQATPGFWGSPVKISEDAVHALRSNTIKAMDELDRKTQLESKVETLGNSEGETEVIDSLSTLVAMYADAPCDTDRDLVYQTTTDQIHKLKTALGNARQSESNEEHVLDLHLSDDVRSALHDSPVHEKLSLHHGAETVRAELR